MTRRDPEYVSWIHSQPCLVCGALPVEAHHVYDGAFGRRPADSRCVPLCWTHHSRDSRDSVHVMGKRFGPEHGIDLESEIHRLKTKHLQERISYTDTAGPSHEDFDCG